MIRVAKVRQKHVETGCAKKFVSMSSLLATDARRGHLYPGIRKCGFGIVYVCIALIWRFSLTLPPATFLFTPSRVNKISLSKVSPLALRTKCLISSLTRDEVGEKTKSEKLYH